MAKTKNRPLKYFGGNRQYSRGAMLPFRYNGRYRDSQGLVWRVYSPDCNSLSAWARLEPVAGQGRVRARFIYDPGYHWRRTLSKRKITTGGCWSGS